MIRFMIRFMIGFGIISAIKEGLTMKAQFIFDLNDEDDKDDFDTMNNAFKYKRILYDLDDYLRDILKYNNEGLSESKLKIYQEIRDWLASACIDENIDLN